MHGCVERTHSGLHGFCMALLVRGIWLPVSHSILSSTEPSLMHSIPCMVKLHSLQHHDALIAMQAQLRRSSGAAQAPMRLDIASHSATRCWLLPADTTCCLCNIQPTQGTLACTH